jgi:hypothetical protein
MNGGQSDAPGLAALYHSLAKLVEPGTTHDFS